MLSAATRALSQLFDPTTFRVLIGSILGSAAILALLWLGIGEGVAHVRILDTGWLDKALRLLLGAGAVVLTLFLFSQVAVVIASLFLERIAASVERRWYPGLPAPRRQPLGEVVLLAVGFLGASLLWNLVAFPFYVFLPGLNVVVFLAINGYLLGREYFELAAQRRVDRATIVRLRRSHPIKLVFAGALIAALSFVPLANLVTPIVAIALMLHVFYGLPELRQDLPSQAFR